MAIFEDGVGYINTKTGDIEDGELLNISEQENPTNWIRVDDNSVGKKFDMGKPDYSLIPGRELNDIAKVFTMGMQKYGRENWKSVKNGLYRYFAANERHVFAYKMYMETGDPKHLYDEESGLHHLAHAATNLIFLMWLYNNDAHTFEDGEMPKWMKEPDESEYDIDTEKMTLRDTKNG